MSEYYKSLREYGEKLKKEDPARYIAWTGGPPWRRQANGHVNVLQVLGPFSDGRWTWKP